MTPATDGEETKLLIRGWGAGVQTRIRVCWRGLVRPPLPTAHHADMLYEHAWNGDKSKLNAEHQHQRNLTGKPKVLPPLVWRHGNEDCGCIATCHHRSPGKTLHGRDRQRRNRRTSDKIQDWFYAGEPQRK